LLVYVVLLAGDFDLGSFVVVLLLSEAVLRVGGLLPGFEMGMWILSPFAIVGLGPFGIGVPASLQAL